MLKTEFAIPIQNGIDPHGLELTTAVSFTHTDPYDLEVYSSDKTFVKVPSKEVMDILKMWDLQRYFSGILTLTNKYKDNEARLNTGYSVDIIKGDYSFKYNCNSRKILKDVNELEKMIKASREMIKRSKYGGLSDVPMTLLITASMCNNHQRTMDLLDRFNTSDIVSKINKPLFRHLYKLIHPSTTFIQKQEQ